MKIAEVRKFISDGDLTFQTREALKSILKVHPKGVLSAEDEKEVRGLLELEIDLLGVREQVFEDLVTAADNFGEEVNEAAAPEMEDLREGLSRREKNLQEFARSVGRRLDRLVSG